MAVVYERIAVARPADANAGSVRALTPEQIVEARLSVRGGLL